MSLADNVAMFPGITTNEYEPNIMLGAAQRADLKSVIIVGYDADGDFWFSSSIADGPDVLWLLEKAKAKLLEIGEY